MTHNSELAALMDERDRLNRRAAQEERDGFAWLAEMSRADARWYAEEAAALVRELQETA